MVRWGGTYKCVPYNINKGVPVGTPFVLEEFLGKEPFQREPQVAGIQGGNGLVH